VTEREPPTDAPATTGAPAPGDDTAQLRAALASAQEDQASAEDRYLRARADLENYRKRSEAEIERRVRERHERLLGEWLEVADSIDRARGVALEHGDQALADGLRALSEQIAGILGRQGVRRLGTVGETFDPAVHEAVATRADAALPEGAVAEVARAGYAVGERVLRPAQVVVVRAGG
jgi:molecular chaperone GrpE